jgi:2',3'-cyclic-nucleotide 2'-phosphodiesterase (5'-nucleotidase family)
VGRAATIRVVCTNDFCGSWAPARTSYGSLPGGEGLKRTVKKLREGQPTVWVDGGDLVQGGPVAALSDGTLGFEAASQLGIDVGTVGNHEFDWGTDHLQENVPRLGFPLLCANANVGLPGTVIVSTDAGDVGFVGMTHPRVDDFSPYGPKPIPRLAEIATGAARNLRSAGAAFVVALLHDGMEWDATGPGKGTVSQARFATDYGEWLGEMDAVVAGHTIVGNWFGRIGGALVAQPWPFGAEVGVIDLLPAGSSRAYGMPVEPGGCWTGVGADLMVEAETQVVGRLEESLTWVRGGGAPLMRFVARALREAAGTDAALVRNWDVGPRQPPLDGVLAWLPGGEVTEADVLTLVPYTDDSVVKVEVTRTELDEIERRASRTIGRQLAIGEQSAVDVGEQLGRTRTLSVAMSAHAAEYVEGWIGRQAGRNGAAMGLRDAIRVALGSSPREDARPFGPRNVHGANGESKQQAEEVV